MKHHSYGVGTEVKFGNHLFLPGGHCIDNLNCCKVWLNSGKKDFDKWMSELPEI